MKKETERWRENRETEGKRGENDSDKMRNEEKI